MGSKSRSSSSNSTETTNIDNRAAASDGGILLKTAGDNSTIMFEDVTPDIIETGFGLAGEAIELFLDKTTGVYEASLQNNSKALTSTQDLAQNLLEEKNTPGSDNMKTVMIAGLGIAGVSLVSMSIWGRK